MSNEARLKLVIDALYQAQSELKELKSDLGDVDDKTQTTSDSLGDLKQGLGDVNTAAKGAGAGIQDLDRGISGAVEKVTGFNLESLTMAGAITGVAAALVDSTRKAAEWGDAMGDLAQLTGGTVRDTSEMAAALELVGVQTGTLEQALKAMTANGLQVNMATLRDLSQEYQALQDPIQQNEFLFENFGRAGLEMAEIMGKSAEELDRLAATARASGKVIGEEAAANAEEFNLRVASLTQKLEGLKVILGNPIISAALGFTDSLTKANQETAEFTVRILRNTGVIDEEQAALRLAAIASGDVFAAFAQQETATQSVTSVTDEQIKTYALLRTMYTDTSGATGEFTLSQEYLRQQAEKTRDELQQNGKAVQDLSALMNGAVGNELDNFAKKQGELKEKGEELRAKIEELEKRKYLTSEQKTQLDDLKTQLGDNNTALAENATAHEEATKRIVFSILQQQAAVDGFTTEEVAALTTVAEKWGLIDPATKQATDAVSTALAEASESGNWEKFYGQIDTTTNKLLGISTAAGTIPTDININVRVNETRFGSEVDSGAPVVYATEKEIKGAPGQPQAEGGVQHAGGYYWVGERGPEPVFPAVDGRVISHGDAMNALRDGAQGSGGGRGGDLYNIAIDARGAMDPLAVEEAGYRGAQRALAEAGRLAEARQTTRAYADY